MPKIFTSKTQKTGEIGENIATKYLVGKGYEILERNFTRKWGEIDIIASKANVIFFVEVKSVSRDNIKDVSYETSPKYISPEQNMNPKKMERLGRTVQTYLMEKNVPETAAWQFDLLCVFLNDQTKQARVVVYENIIL